MKYPKSIVAISLCLVSFLGTGTYYFRSYLQADSTYKITTKSRSNMTIKFIAGEDFLKGLESNGFKNPSSISTNQSIEETVTTGKMSTDSSFFFRTSVDKFDMAMKVNGVESNPLKSSKMMDVEITGLSTKDHKMTNVRVDGGNFSEGMRSALAASITNISSLIHYPDRPIAIGDSFQEIEPTTIAVPGNEPVQINVVADFKLIRVQDNIGYFDTHYKIVAGQNTQDYNLTASGGGTGTLAHDLSRNFVTAIAFDLQMKVKVVTDKMQMILDSKTHTDSNYR